MDVVIAAGAAAYPSCMGSEPTITGEITTLLRRAGSGDSSARDELFERIYPELQGMARAALHAGGFERLGINATSVVNMACIKWLGHDRSNVENRRHFFFVLSRAIHDVLVEEARRAAAQKRDGNHRRVTLEDTIEGTTPENWDVMDLHEALKEYEKVDPEGASVVHLRFFACRTLEETAEVSGMTLAVVRRHLRYAMAWLRARLAESGRVDDSTG